MNLHGTTLLHVAQDMLTASLGHEVSHINQTYSLFVIVVYDTKIKCCGLLKHVLKLYDNHSNKQFYLMENVYIFAIM